MRSDACEITVKPSCHQLTIKTIGFIGSYYSAQYKRYTGSLQPEMVLVVEGTLSGGSLEERIPATSRFFLHYCRL